MTQRELKLKLILILSAILNVWFLVFPPCPENYSEHSKVCLGQGVFIRVIKL